MLKYFIFLSFFIFITNTNANNKTQIIENLEKTKNLSFEFEQNINRVWVHTCSLDHKNALNNYIDRGMKIFKTERIKI